MTNVAKVLWAACFSMSMAAAQVDVPRGHPDFYPSSDRPAGYRGDGSGLYPGATPPLSFDEASGKNLKWVARMPGWSHSPPLVVGKKIIVEAEPDTTLCVDANTGAILWQDSLGRLALPTGNQGGWAFHSGNGYSTASSDGAAVYRLFSGRSKAGGKKGGSLLVSYDLKGRRRWLTETIRLSHLQSPLLVGDRLMIGSTAFDTATGKVAWGPTKDDLDPGEPKPWGSDDASLVKIRLGNQDVVLTPGGWCLDPKTGKRLAKALAMRSTNGRPWHPLGLEVGAFISPVSRANADGSATVIFSAVDGKGRAGDSSKRFGHAVNDLDAAAIPPDADLTQPPWAGKRVWSAIRVLACRLSLDANGRICSEPMWDQPAAVAWELSSGQGPHLALCGDRIAVLNVKGNMAVLDLKTGRLLGKDFQAIYDCGYRAAAFRGVDISAPEIKAAMAEFGISDEVCWGRGTGGPLSRNTDFSMSRMGRALYARSAVDSRNLLWIAHRLGEIYVLELNDTGFRIVAHNRVIHPPCWCSHAALVFQRKRLYYRTFGRLYCFEDTTKDAGNSR